MSQIKIVGGMSSCEEISIMSDKFISTARLKLDSDGFFAECVVQSHSALFTMANEPKRLPIPKVLLLVLGFWENMTWQQRIYTGVFILFNLYLIFFPSHISVNSNLFITLSSYLALALQFYIYFYFFIAKWHGAEHMAIAAYEHTNSTELDVIAGESRISDKCGGRLFFPIILVVVLSHFAPDFGVNTWLAYFALLEGALWVDSLWGWDKIPITAQASRLLQKYITTRVPGELELFTAQIALKELIASHQEEAED